ncbi:hypothetical protein BV898_19687 [Hypsibius exemplaris]|uniref:Uncharacterized protein n=1 Tax=Hypsibius exemplaris TaxID=2072580 RepID=A0A9X6NLC5_HYPEX|nr:hypothetical protein BV898_19687 [Hypsibius exemplaris]
MARCERGLAVFPACDRGLHREPCVSSMEFDGAGFNCLRARCRGLSDDKLALNCMMARIWWHRSFTGGPFGYASNVIMEDKHRRPFWPGCLGRVASLVTVTSSHLELPQL